jgi:hypothetical protein
MFTVDDIKKKIEKKIKANKITYGRAFDWLSQSLDIKFNNDDFHLNEKSKYIHFILSGTFVPNSIESDMIHAIVEFKEEIELDLMEKVNCEKVTVDVIFTNDGEKVPGVKPKYVITVLMYLEEPMEVEE